MKINFDISEPWELSQEPMRHVILDVVEAKSTSDGWIVRITSGWDGEKGIGLLTARHRGNGLSELKRGKSILSNLVRISMKNEHEVRDMVVGEATLLKSFRNYSAIGITVTVYSMELRWELR